MSKVVAVIAVLLVVAGVIWLKDVLVAKASGLTFSEAVQQVEANQKAEQAARQAESDARVAEALRRAEEMKANAPEIDWDEVIEQSGNAAGKVGLGVGKFLGGVLGGAAKGVVTGIREAAVDGITYSIDKIPDALVKEAGEHDLKELEDVGAKAGTVVGSALGTAAKQVIQDIDEARQ